MIDTDELLRRANFEIGRLNRELAAIHEDEERCKLRRSRAEAEKTKVQLLIDQHRLAQRLTAQPPDDPTAPVRIEKLDCGANLVHIDKPLPVVRSQELIAPEPERRRLKPDGLPTISKMIITALREVGKASRPVEIAEFVRRRWWAAAPTESITTAAWQMARAGKLTHHDGRYGLNGVGQNGAGH